MMRSPDQSGAHIAARIWCSRIDSPPDSPVGSEPLGGPLLMVVPTALLAVLTLAIGLAAGPIYELSVRAATDLLDPSAYVSVVMG